jgi:hypothetical protein
VRAWINDQLTNEYTNVKLRDEAVSWNAIELNGWYDTIPQNQYSWIDQVVVSNQRIGCGAPTIRRAGDLNGDGVVNILDVSLIIQNFKRRGSYDNGADINNDGTVNILDMVLLGRNWG